MAEHTPPPWTITPSDATWGWWWVHTADCDLTISGDRAEANANLIAAAPELVFAAEKLLICEFGSAKCPGCRQELAAAIAKAKGEPCPTE